MGDYMIQVEVLDEEHEEDLKAAINDFLIENDMIEIIDIKFSTAAFIDKEEQIYCFSAMIIYKYES
ncbi:MAG: sporulation protein Cse60 [Erysipelotrichaceae bacterium]